MRLTKAEAKFINAAVCKDVTRRHLTMVHACVINDVKWLCATDGHRLHMVRHSDDVVREGYVIVSKDGDVGLSPQDMKFPDVAQVIPSKHPYVGLVETDLLAAISSGRSDLLRVAFLPHAPSKPIVQIDAPQYGAPKGAVCVDTRYSADALIIATDRKRGMASVWVRFGEPLSPIVYEDPIDEPQWRAVIMPVRLGNGG